jgi:multidrug resistance efflux pump
MAVAFVRAGGYLIDLGQPLALLLLTWLVGARSQRRLRRLFGSRSRVKQTQKQAATVVEDDDEEDEDSVEAPTQLPAIQEPSRMTTARTSLAQFSQGLVKPLRRVPRRILVLVPVVLVLLLIRVELRIPGPFKVLPEGNADVRSAVEGIVEQVMVTEGDSVRSGQVIARLSARALRAELNKTEAEIRENESGLKRLSRGSTADQIGVAREGAARAADKVAFAQTRLTRTRELFDMGSATRQELESAQEEAASAKSDLGEAQGRLKILQRAQPEAIEAARAQADRLEVEKRYLEEQLTLLDIVSPVSGIVATPEAQLRAMEGQLVSRGSLIARVYDFTSLTAQIVIPEKEIADVKVGLPVVLKARAYPDAQFKGLVTAIATTAEGTATATPSELSAGMATEGDSPAQKFIVTTRIANPDLLLKPGMTGQAKVQGGQWRVIGLVKRRLARTFKVQFWSWW